MCVAAAVSVVAVCYAVYTVLCSVSLLLYGGLCAMYYVCSAVNSAVLCCDAVCAVLYALCYAVLCAVCIVCCKMSAVCVCVRSRAPVLRSLVAKAVRG